jgi:hypothetical protein
MIKEMIIDSVEILDGLVQIYNIQWNEVTMIQVHPHIRLQLLMNIF